MARYFVLILALIASSVFAEAEKMVSGTVYIKNGKLNVRVKPGKQFFVVATLKNGDKVKIYRKVGDWYEIAAPLDSSVWVAGYLLSKSRTRRPANLRAGPSDDYQAYRIEPPGVELEVLDKEGHKGWFKIKPPVDLKAWVSSRFVVMDQQKLDELQQTLDKRKLILVDTDTGKYAGFLKDKYEKPAFVLPFVKGAEKEVSFTGEIVPLKEGAVYVTHAVVSVNNSDYAKPYAYLHCPNASLNVWEEKLVTVTGTRRLVRGWKLPVLEVEEVVPAKAEETRK